MKRLLYLTAGAVIIAGGIGIGVLSRHHTRPAQSVTTVTSGTYIALGDSVAAGQGLMNDRDASACDRTNESYPVLVAKRLHFDLTDVTCSGATTTTGISGRQTVNQLALAPQLDALKKTAPPS